MAVLLLQVYVLLEEDDSIDRAGWLDGPRDAAQEENTWRDQRKKKEDEWAGPTRCEREEGGGLDSTHTYIFFFC